MRKSQSKTRSRLLRAGLATAATTALTVAGLSAPAYAANVAVTVTPSSGLPAGTIAVAGTGVLTGITTPAATFQTAACPATYATGVGSPTITKTSDNAATISVPTTLTPGTAYKVCIFAGNSAGTSAIAGNGVYTVVPLGTASPTSGVAVGGNTVAVTSTGLFATPTTLGATFTTNPTCTAAYSTATGYIAATAAKTTGATAANVANVTVPATGLTAPGAYTVCLYGGTTTSSTLLGYTTYNLNAPLATLSATSGPNGGGNSVTATAASSILSGVTAPGVNFSVAACPSTYSSSPANLAPTVTRVSDTQLSFSVPTGVLAPDVYNVCIYNGTTNSTSALIGSSSATYSLALPSLTLSPTAGPSTGGNTITAASTTNYLTGITTPGATFSTSACTSTYSVGGSGPYAGTTVRRLATNKAAITVPAGVTGSVPTPWNVCVYNGTSAGTSTLVANPAVYTVAPALGTPSISPSGGPAQGGSEVTITATGLPASADLISASIGGSPITDITLASGGGAFTGLTSPHVADTNLTLSVTTTSGTKTVANAFSYSNGIQIGPKTAPNTGPLATVDIDVLGVGFSSLTFGNTSGTASHSTDATAHVYLVKGAYNSSDGVTTTHAADKLTGPVAECTSVVVISDTELICTLTLTGSLDSSGAAAAGTPVPIGTYTLTTVSNGAVDAGGEVADPNYAQSIISSGSTFTVAPY